MKKTENILNFQVPVYRAPSKPSFGGHSSLLSGDSPWYREEEEEVSRPKRIKKEAMPMIVEEEERIPERTLSKRTKRNNRPMRPSKKGRRYEVI